MQQPSPDRAATEIAGKRQMAGLRFEGLDAARGIGALLVVFGHYNFEMWPERHFFTNQSSGYLVVDVFFMLSGFVLAHAFFDRPEFRFRDYAAKRIFRLWPLHMATLMAFAVLMLWNADPVSLKGFALNAMMLHNVGVGDLSMVGFNYPSWSISVEFVSNLVIGALLIAVPGRWLGNVMLAGICIVSAAILFATVPHLDRQLQNVFGGVNTGLLRGFVSFPLGILAYRFFSAQRGWFEQTSIARTVLIGLAILLFFTTLCIPGRSKADIAYLPFYALFITLIACPGPFWMAVFRPFLWLGKISFALYMVHMLVIKAMRETGAWPQDYAAGLAAVILVSVLLAAGAHYGVERPTYDVLNGIWSRRFRPGPRRRPAADWSDEAPPEQRVA
ncbi:acyltransferase family protein [Hyphomonas sp.]|uniref:acyltransferase family protein n=1 Tax=Hyphomonas sp. TaxID=87 RepID=UPI00391B99BF